MYDADVQDELELDALAYGGQDLVDDIHAEAVEYVDETYPWHGIGDEPAERVSAYLAVWWQRVDLARADLLGKRVMRAGESVLVGPARCPLGHVLDDEVVMQRVECLCSGHDTWTCRERVIGEHECGAVVYYPAVGQDCLRA